jgi:type VI secretion system protein ImpI
VIRPRENNPLKFSPDASAAMEHLFGSRKPGYLSAEQAFAEAFDDIKAHQVAMLAGMRAAFEHMLQQFSPAALEEQFDGKGKRGGLMGRGGKARYWEMYQEFFERITRDSDDNFRRLFGEEFAAAYEDQMKRITRRK